MTTWEEQLRDEWNREDSLADMGWELIHEVGARDNLHWETTLALRETYSLFENLGRDGESFEDAARGLAILHTGDSDSFVRVYEVAEHAFAQGVMERVLVADAELLERGC